MKKRLAALIPLLTVLIVLLVFQTLLFIGFVPSASMEPTLRKNSLILGVRCFGRLKSGDIIIFRRDGKLLVKRIAGTAGETVEIGDETYCVPEGKYFVLGDNRGDSFDSRYWSDPYLKEKEIVAKLVLP